MSTAPQAPASSAGKYLTAVVGNEAFGIAVFQVREIIRLQKITPVPQMPEFVKGVINLRGRVIPIIDLRVDSVEEVVNLAGSEIEPTPDFGARIDTAYILGMAKINGKVKTLLDIDRVVAPAALSAVVTQAA